MKKPPPQLKTVPSTTMLDTYKQKFPSRDVTVLSESTERINESLIKDEDLDSQTPFTTAHAMSQWKEDELEEYRQMNELKSTIEEQFFEMTSSVYDLLAWKDLVTDVFLKRKGTAEDVHSFRAVNSRDPGRQMSQREQELAWSTNDLLIIDLLLLCSNIYRKDMSLADLLSKFFRLVFSNAPQNTSLLTATVPQKQSESEDVTPMSIVQQNGAATGEEMEPRRSSSKRNITDDKVYPHASELPPTPEHPTESSSQVDDDTSHRQAKTESNTEQVERTSKNEIGNGSAKKVDAPSSTLKTSRKESAMPTPTAEPKFDNIAYRMMMKSVVNERQKRKELEDIVERQNEEIVKMKRKLADNDSLLVHMKQENVILQQRSQMLETKAGKVYDEMAQQLLASETQRIEATGLDIATQDTVLKGNGAKFDDTASWLQEKLKDLEENFKEITLDEGISRSDSHTSRKMGVMKSQLSQIIPKFQTMRKNMTKIANELNSVLREKYALAKQHAERWNEKEQEKQRMAQLNQDFNLLKNHIDQFISGIEVLNDDDEYMLLDSEHARSLTDGTSLGEDEEPGALNLKQILRARLFETMKHMMQMQNHLSRTNENPSDKLGLWDTSKSSRKLLSRSAQSSKSTTSITSSRKARSASTRRSRLPSNAPSIATSTVPPTPLTSTASTSTAMTPTSSATPTEHTLVSNRFDLQQVLKQLSNIASPRTPPDVKMNDGGICGWDAKSGSPSPPTGTGRDPNSTVRDKAGKKPEDRQLQNKQDISPSSFDSIASSEQNALRKQFNARLAFMKDVYEHRITELETKLAEVMRQQGNESPRRKAHSAGSTSARLGKGLSMPFRYQREGTEQKTYVTKENAKHEKRESEMNRRDVPLRESSVSPRNVEVKRILTMTADKDKLHATNGPTTTTTTTTRIPASNNPHVVENDGDIVSLYRYVADDEDQDGRSDSLHVDESDDEVDEYFPFKPSLGDQLTTSEIWTRRKQMIIEDQKRGLETTLYHLSLLDHQYASVVGKELLTSKELKWAEEFLMEHEQQMHHLPHVPDVRESLKIEARQLARERADHMVQSALLRMQKQASNDSSHIVTFPNIHKSLDETSVDQHHRTQQDNAVTTIPGSWSSESRTKIAIPVTVVPFIPESKHTSKPK